MAPESGRASFRYDDGLELTIVEVKAPVFYRDVLGIFREWIEPRATRHLIWIVHPGALSELTTDDFKDFYTNHRASVLQRAGGQTIYVAPEEAENTLCHWGRVYVERRAEVPIAIHVVRTLDEAYDLLKNASERDRHTISR